MTTAETVLAAPPPAGAPQRPVVRMLPGKHKRARFGHPWVYSNEIDMTAEAKAIAPGEVVVLETASGDRLGTWSFNPRPLISARLLDPDPAADIGTAFFAARLDRALRLRERLVPVPFYRLIHAEADGLPGVVVDRFGDIVVVQRNAAWAERRTEALLEALDEVLAPTCVVLRDDTGARALEGLESGPAVARGPLETPIELVENGVRFLADVTEGQKTGWFFDHRDNRAAVAALAEGARMLDVYAYLGGFGLQAAARGAAEIVCVDRSAPALALAERSAELNGLGGFCSFVRGEAFAEMARLHAAAERFDIVACDPPAFVKTKKDLHAGARGYRKMVRLAAPLVAPGGFLFVASCSHHVDAALFAEEVRHGMRDARRMGRILRTSGAAPDHPVHPFLPESAYLKSLLIQLD